MPCLSCSILHLKCKRERRRKGAPVGRWEGGRQAKGRVGGREVGW